MVFGLPAINESNWGQKVLDSINFLKGEQDGRLSDATLSATYGPQTEAVVAAAQNGVAVGNTAAANTTALNELHTSAAALGAAIALPPGTLQVNALTLKVPMRGAGKGKTIIQSGSSHKLDAVGVELSDLTFLSSTAMTLNLATHADFTLRNVAFDYTAAVTTDWVAANFYQMPRVRVLNCSFRIGGIQFSGCDDLLVDGNYWDCEYLNTNEPCHISQQSSGQFVNNTVYRTLTDGLDLYSSGEYCVVANNRFYGLRGATGIEVKVTMSDDPANSSSAGNVIDAVVISNNILRDFNPPAGNAVRTGIFAEYVDSRAVPAFSVAETNRAVIITGNVLEDFLTSDPGGGAVVSYWAIQYTGHNGLIANNIIRNMRSFNGSSPVGIYLAQPSGTKCVGVRVAGNVVAGVEGTYGIRTGNLERCQIEGNVIRDDEVNGTTTKYGIYVNTNAVLADVAITNNTFDLGAPGARGIVFQDTSPTLTRAAVSGNILKNCSLLLNGAVNMSTFTGNVVDDASGSLPSDIGSSGKSSRGNTFIGNTFTMSADYALSLLDFDGFAVIGNTFRDTNRGLLLNDSTKNGVVDNNISINQTGGTEFPHYSGVTDVNKASIRVGANNVNGSVATPEPYVYPGRLTTGEVIPNRELMQSQTVAPTSGTLAMSFFTADKTETISNLTVYTGSTAAGATPTLCRMGIYELDSSGNGTLVASTANDTTLFAATGTAYTKALSSSFTKVAGKRYATALLVVTGATAPTFHGPTPLNNAVVSTVLALAPAVNGRLTDQTDLPASFTAGSVTSYQQRVTMYLS